jgi:hypothetical protein
MVIARAELLVCAHIERGLAAMCQGIDPAIFALPAVGEKSISDEAAIVAMDRGA